MRKMHKILAVGAATLLCAGAAVAATHDSHVMTVDLPDGSVAHIHYIGKVAPKVSVIPADVRAIDLFDPLAPSGASPFAAINRISARIDREFAAMIQQTAAMERQTGMMQAGGAMQPAALGTLPPGATVRYSYVSTTTGNGTCSQSVEWTSDGAHQQPRVIRTSSGDCSAVKPQTARKVSTPAPAAPAETGHKI